MFLNIPVIDISSLVSDNRLDTVANQIRQACCGTGFFYIVEHGVDKGLQNRLEQLSRQFFALDLETKMQIRMALGGRAWRRDFPVGGELTDGKPDLKEGIYFRIGIESNPSGCSSRYSHVWSQSVSRDSSVSRNSAGVSSSYDSTGSRSNGWNCPEFELRSILLPPTPHRVKNVSEGDRLSFPFFFDPNFNAELHPIKIKGAIVDDNKNEASGLKL